MIETMALIIIGLLSLFVALVGVAGYYAFRHRKYALISLEYQNRWLQLLSIYRTQNWQETIKDYKSFL